jgi:biotin operon repressor
VIGVQGSFVVDKFDMCDVVTEPGVTPALLHEMMRSFTALAGTLNLSQAVQDLGSTRQTVRRHISQLEAAMGCKLFEVEHRRYALTDHGTHALRPAQTLLDQGRVWYRGQFQDVDGMLRFSFNGGKGWIYHQQQQPMSVVWLCKSDLMRAALRAWTLAEGMLESAHLVKVRPYVLVYRAMADSWICVEVGERSFYAQWFGWSQARSSVGRNLNQFPGGEEFASLANAPFADINNGHSVRLDQVVSKMQLKDTGPMQMVAFDRLLMGVRMPDGSPAIVSVVDRSCEIRIKDLAKNILEAVPESAKVDFVA